MQAWPGQNGPCFLCSLRYFARWTLRSSNQRGFATSSENSRNRVHERISKGRWKDSILSTLEGGPREANGNTRNGRDRQLQSSGEAIRRTKSGGLVLRMEGSGKPAAELELQSLKQTLRDGKTPDGVESGYAELDPELKYFDSFEAKVTKCFEKQDRMNGNLDITNPLRVSLLQAFVRGGRAELRKALLFAYVDHILQSGEKRSGSSSTPKHLDLRYPTEWYLHARAIQREIHLHVGPTNSGKTYHALKRLEESGNGIYAGPLRLLAHEVYSRFKNKGTPCDLVTGDDVRLAEGGGALLSSHTVEMVDCGKSVDVAVIDEIQMLANKDRGWAWTRALLGTKAKELHLCGETRVVPLIRELAASMGDTLHIHHYDRLNPLKAMSKSLKGNLKSLRRGDCIVCFSVLGIHAMKKQIELDTGRRVAIVYGSLPPEIRAQQAALFNDPSNDYDFLVASDAIGMGLNLSIKRIIFETILKMDGEKRVKLSISQIKQIAGRAGRYRTANQDDQEDGAETKIIDSQDSRVTSFKGSVKQSNVGLVTCLDERDLFDIQTALNTEPDPIKAAGIQPPLEHINSFAKVLPPGTPFEYIIQRLDSEVMLHSRYFLCKLGDRRRIATLLDKVRGLTVVQSCVFTAAPVDTKSELGKKVIKALARCVANRTAVTVVDITEIPLDILDLPLSGRREYLVNLELLHKSLILFLWLSYRFTNIFLDREMATRAKEMVEEKINTALLEFSANPKLRSKVLQMRHAKPDEEVSGDSPDGSQEETSEGMMSGPVEEDLTKSFSELSALPVNWENPTPSDEWDPNAERLAIEQPAAAQP
ncbi:hypothetical protein EPUS_00463 [Endocarpon pusillum Z07020]|uniref:RNA helicase n=1 Tax=Endocarpon pusillum (strain Z07020 / HMAS-L-300199) TaxID=1263415 RepID=U1HQU4_ENDPU|nr:uncharacterized protein EPUS_00463 [Endocarpon pusillum Z07020]ERF71474.1 hypothetical protein EPUS_00463 [Endocarpon pusillum Z07020]